MGTYVAPGLRATHKLVAPSEPQGLIDPDELTHGLVGPPLYTIMADEVERSSVVAAKFEDVELVGSYSWIKGEKPAILVPGQPDVWKPDVTGQLGDLRQDNRIPGYKRMANLNGYRLLPDISTLEPIFHSIDSPEVLNDIEIITDRNSLRKLYKLFTPDAVHERRPFRIDPQLVGGTVLLCRWEKHQIAPQEPNKWCWAQSYHLATSRRQVEGIISYSQIIGCYGLLGQSNAFPESPTSPYPGDGADDVDHPSDASSFKAGLRPLPALTERIGGIDIHRSQYPSPPLSSFIENKTRSLRGEMDFVDIYGQLVFSQTSNLYVARHHNGYFQTLEKLKLGEGKLAGIAEAAEQVLDKVAAMLEKMIEITKEHKEVSFVWSGTGMEVGVWKFDGHVALSDAAKGMLERA